MNADTTKALLGYTLAGALVWVLVKVFCKKPEIKYPEVTQVGIDTAVIAYQTALTEGHDLQTLNELNEELAREYAVRVGLRSDGKYIVSNLAGKQIRAV